MSVSEKVQPVESAENKKRRILSPEKKYQIFLESQKGQIPVGEILRREGFYSTDLARIQHKVKVGALERLADRPGRKKKTVSEETYEALKKDLEELALELAVLRRKTNGGSWAR